MAKFAKPAKQALSAIRKVQRSGNLKSVGTGRNYRQALTRAAEYASSERVPGGLQGLSREHAICFLEIRGQVVGQKTLDLDRQALQSFLRSTGKLQPSERLPVIKSEHSQALQSRAYTREQVRRIAAHQQATNALATEIAHAAGLRAHELLTLQPAKERNADARPARNEKFLGRSGNRYVVVGKGGLAREVLLPIDLTERLEALSLDAPMVVADRGVYYKQHYKLPGGRAWSQSVTAASQRALGWSTGAHGLRHSYAQQRMVELQTQGLLRTEALETVSQELGHFRPEITEIYLR